MYGSPTAPTSKLFTSKIHHYLDSTSQVLPETVVPAEELTTNDGGL